MQAKTARFTETVVSLARKAVVGQPAPAYRPCNHGCPDWVVLAIQGLKEHLGRDYRKLLDVLGEMPRVTRLLRSTI